MYHQTKGMNLKLKIYTKLIVSITSILSIGLVVFISINSSYYINKMSKNNAELYNAYRVSELMKSYKSKIIALDNSQKGYLITGDAKFIEQFKIKESELKTDLKSMEPFFDSTSEEQYFENLKELTYKKLSQLKDLNQQTNFQGFKNTRNDELESSTLDEISMALDEINISLSFHTKKLLDNSVEYLRASRTRSIIEIILGVLVLMAGLVVLFRDINLRNELELELRKAKQQAEDNANAKEQFMANMSHEIRTPMNSILGFSKLLDKTPLNEKQSEYLKSITNSGSNLLSIINDILDFSKIEAGKLQLEKINFNLHDLLSAIQVMFYQKAFEKNIGFAVHKEKILPSMVFGDPTRLNQILVNLINNAIKFTQQGSVELNCEVKHIEHNLVTLVFRVKDSGIGIPKDKIEHVFERFNQGNKETTRKFGGTGLGLAIVKDLIELQNGEIYVKSKEGFGSEFVVTLSFPLVFENASPAQENTKFEYEKLAHGDKNILLVEDNTLNQKLAIEYLSDFGFLVDSASNGEEAIQKLNGNKYDLVLMDIQMPVLDGYNTTKLIRKQLKLNLPVIAMTAHVTNAEKEKCINAGMDDYISKPFMEKDLYEIIAKHLQLKTKLIKFEGNEAIQKPTTEGKLVNTQDLIDLSRGNNQFIFEMIDIYTEQNPADLNEIAKAINEQNYGNIRMIAHRMKTSVGFMGIASLLQPLSDIEELAEKKQDLLSIQNKFSKLKTDCEASVVELQVFKKQIKHHNHET